MTRTPSRLAAVQMVVFAASVALLFLPRTAPGMPLSAETCCRLLLVHTVWALLSWQRACGLLFHPYVLFLLAATLFNAGLALLQALGLTQELLASYPPDLVLRSLQLVFAALAAMHFGALLAVSSGYRRDASEAPDSDVALRIAGCALLAISLLPLAVKLHAIVEIVASGGYMALYQRGIAAAGASSAMSAAADLVLPGSFFMLAGSAGRPRYRTVALAVLATYSATMLYAGWRALSLMPLVSAAWLWERTIFRIPRILIASAAVIVVGVVVPVVRATRGLSASERASSSYSDLAELPAVAGVEEMGGTIETVALTVELVPAYRPYDFGRGYAYALLTIMPSLFWSPHPSVARGIPSVWLTETVDPFVADQGGSLGFSFVADAFLNFGALGVPLFALLMGFAIVRLCQWAEGSTARLATVATFIPWLLFCARSELDFLPRPLVWYGLCPYALFLLVRRALPEVRPTPSNGRAIPAQAHQFRSGP
jgi:oligosaccharide repeat unit polymerase